MSSRLKVWADVDVTCLKLPVSLKSIYIFWYVFISEALICQRNSNYGWLTLTPPHHHRPHTPFLLLILSPVDKISVTWTFHSHSLPCLSPHESVFICVEQLPNSCQLTISHHQRQIIITEKVIQTAEHFEEHGFNPILKISNGAKLQLILYESIVTLSSCLFSRLGINCQHIKQLH